MVRQWLLYTAYGDARSFCSFRQAEFDSVIKILCNGNNNNDDDDDDDGSSNDHNTAVIHDEWCNDSAFLQFDAPLQVAKLIPQRMVLCKGVYELWAHGPTLQSLIEQVTQCSDRMPIESYSFCVDVRTFGWKMSPAYKQQIRSMFLDGKYAPLSYMTLREDCTVDLTTPQQRLCIMLDFGGVDTRPKKTDLSAMLAELRTCYFYRELPTTSGNVATARSFVDKYDLSARSFIGPTSTKAELALLMANQALVTSNSLVYDPFCGTGSILVACAHFGAMTVGAELNPCAVLGVRKGVKIGVNVFSPFQQYRLTRPDILQADNAVPVWRQGWKIDAIVCDPPYGIRESGKQTGQTAAREKRVTARARQRGHSSCSSKFMPNDKVDPLPYHPPTKAYPSRKLMTDTFRFAAKHLVMGGRLVYLLPGLQEWTEEDMPSHWCFRMVSYTQQLLMMRKRVARFCITMEKVKEYNAQVDADVVWNVRLRDRGRVNDVDPMDCIRELAFTPAQPGSGKGVKRAKLNTD